MKLLALALLVSTSAFAQAAHQVTLTVTSPDTSAAAPGTASILRSTGSCPASGLPSGGNTLISTLSVPGTANYVDTGVIGGTTYCYWSTLKTQGGGSGVSNTFQGAITVSVSITGVVQ